MVRIAPGRKRYEKVTAKKLLRLVGNPMAASDLLAPDVTQLSLPDLPDSRRLRFQSATIEILTQRVLSDSSRSHGGVSSTPQSALGELANAEAALADPALAGWLIKVQTAKFKASQAESANGYRLAEALVRSAEWLDESEPAQRLWQVANMVVRLQTLEHRFDSELERQKREAIYHFAYGLSHELNNPLANIATRAGVLVQRESAADRRQMLETIIDNAMRGSEMLGDLMLIARPPQMQLQSVDLRQWFETFVARARGWSSKRGVTITESFRRGQCVEAVELGDQTDAGNAVMSECLVRFDPIAMNEALWCLVRNAVEASREGESIELRVEVYADTNAEIDCKNVCEKGSGGRVKSICWIVRDSGPGLSEVALRHCFDPYFSGREAGRGLGLGLSKALLIATAHGGTLTIANRFSGGAGRSDSSSLRGGCEARLMVPSALELEAPSRP